MEYNNLECWLYLDQCSLVARISPYLCPITVAIIWRIVSNFTGGGETLLLALGEATIVWLN